VIARLRGWWFRLKSAIWPGRAESELDREVRAHLDLLADEFQRRGLAPADARAAASRAFGGIEQAKDRHRDARSFVWIDDAVRDLRHATRLLRRNPLFTLTAVLSLAIGIGANTTVFTLGNALLLATPIGVANPNRLIDIGRDDRGSFNNLSYPNYLDLRERARTLEGLYAYLPAGTPMSLGNSGIAAERIFGNLVTNNYFTVLGVRPAVGRLLDARDNEQSGASPLVVLNYGFWVRRFDADPAIVGRQVQLNGQAFRVIGVTPAGFQGTSLIRVDLWTSVSMAAVVMSKTGDLSLLHNRGINSFFLGARLKPGVSVNQAAAELEMIAAELAREYPTENRGERLRVMASAPIPGNLLPVAGFLALLLGIVSLVLLVACANVAGILLARAAARRREIAVRLAMGAGRARLVRQLLTETGLLFGLGAAGGLLIAREMTSLLVLFMPIIPIPIDVGLALDGRVIALTMGLSLSAALLSGLVPALQASRTDVLSTLKDAADGSLGRVRFRRAFVVGQVTCSVILVVCAGLFARALQRAATIDPGFDPHGVELALVDLSLAGYSDTTGPPFAKHVLDRLRALPGVQEATVATTVPMGGSWRLRLGVPGVLPPAGQRSWEVNGSMVESRYFATLRIPLVAGRDFNDADRAGTSSVAIVSEATVKQFWPGQDPLGKGLILQNGSDASPGRSMAVIGVAHDANYRSLGETPRPFVYVPLQQQYSPQMMIAVRTTQGERFATEIRALVTSLNPALPIISAQTFSDLTAVALVPQRVAASASGALGLVGLLLAAIGIYGVSAYMVTSRTREFGIRIALGARPATVVAMVLRQGMSLAVIGSAVGLALGAVAGRLMRTFLFGAAPLDLVTFVAVAATFLLVGLAASYWPARRATRIDPIEALRYE
jgi:predicted permease